MLNACHCDRASWHTSTLVFLSQVSFVLPDIVEQVRDAQIALRSDKDRKRPGRSNQLDGFDLQKAEKVVLN